MYPLTLLKYSTNFKKLQRTEGKVEKGGEGEAEKASPQDIALRTYLCKLDPIT